MKTIINGTSFQMLVGDITEQETEAIVNAANSSLMGGGGVDGAIHRAGGPQILEQCREIRSKQGKLPAGEAVITGGGNLKASYVIHTVGPIWSGGKNLEDEKLAGSYRSSLRLALQNGISSISFPSISTGAYHFPLKRAARIALNVIREFLQQHRGLAEVRLVLFKETDYESYLSVWREIGGRD